MSCAVISVALHLIGMPHSGSGSRALHDYRMPHFGYSLIESARFRPSAHHDRIEHAGECVR